MTAKQTVASAAFGIMLALAGLAHAEPVAIEPRPDTASQGTGTGMGTGTGTFEVGAGYQPDDGFIATARVAHDNLLGTDKALALAAAISERRQRAAFTFRDPRFLGTELTLDASLFAEERQYRGFSRQTVGVQAQLSRTIAPHLSAFVGYRLERVTATPSQGLLIADRALLPSPVEYRLATLRSGFEYTTLDQPGLPTRGSRAGIAIEIADRDLGSHVNLQRVEVWAEHHRALGPFLVHVGARVETVSGDPPWAERVHFDGSRDLRGYAPGALGPVDSRTGMALGGSGLATARLELEVPLVKRWGLSLVGGFDAGAMRSPDQLDVGASVSFGILWRSPIGPLRLGVAVPLGGERRGELVPLFGLGFGF